MVNGQGAGPGPPRYSRSFAEVLVQELAAIRVRRGRIWRMIARPDGPPGPGAEPWHDPVDADRTEALEGIEGRKQKIADDLVLSHETVKTHVKRMLAKLGVRDRAQAVVAAYEAGLVAAGDSVRER